MPQSAFVPPQQPEAIRYQDHLGSPSRSEKTIQRILSQSTRVHILRDKIDDSTAKQLELRLQRLGAQLTSTPDAANVIITVLKAPKRIAKHFSDKDVNVFPFTSSADGKEETEANAKEEEVDRMLGEGTGRDWRRFVVTPDWIRAVENEATLVDPDLFPAVALKAVLNADHVEEPQPTTTTITRENGGLKRKRSPSDSPLLPTSHTSKPSRPSLKRSPSSSNLHPSSPSPSTSKDAPPGYYSPLQPPPTCPRWQNTRFACRRPSPLFSPNQPLIAELELIRTERKLTGDTYSEMAYMRAISALKACPFRIPDPLLDPPSIFDSTLLELRLAEVEKLKGVGKKVFSLIKQYFHPTTSVQEECRIIEAKVIYRDRAVFIMNSFTELYGIGPIGAREAYNSGARSFGDVLNRGKSLATHLSVRESIRILRDLRIPIPRKECESITSDIIKLVKTVLGPNVEVKHEICGGYRRGKQKTYDLDIIIGHNDPPSRALHMRLLDEMKKKGLITHIVNVSTPPPSLDSPSDSNAKHIDIANIVVLPTLTCLSRSNSVHRRVDLVFCPLKVYGATVLGWTGSLTFERDLRLWAKQKGYNFSFDGLTHLSLGEGGLVETKSEKDVFDILGLDWIDAEWRNCDA